MIKVGFKYSLIAVFILLIISVVFFSWFISSQSGLNYVTHQVKPYLPNDFTFEKIEGSLVGPIKISVVHYKDETLKININEIKLDWSVRDLLFATLNIESIELEQLNIVFLTTGNSISKSTNTTINKAIQLPNIVLPWLMNINELRIHDVTLKQGDKIVQFNEVKLSAKTFLDEVNINSLDIINDQYSINVKGVVKPVGSYEHNLKLNWSGLTNANTSVYGTGKIQGNMREVNIKQQTSGAIKLDISAKITDILTKFNWTTKIDVSEYNPSKIITEWPDFNGELQIRAHGDLVTASIKGNASITHTEYGHISSYFDLQHLKDNHIKINNITFNSGTRNNQLTMRGDWLIINKFPGELALALNWSNLRWPLNSEPVLTSSVGSAWVKGNMDSFKLEFVAKQPLALAPEYLLFASLSGKASDTGLIIKSLDLSELDQTNNSSTLNNVKTGTLSANAEIHWSPSLSWKTNIVVDNINPVRLVKRWPGQIDASLINTGKIVNNSLQVNTDIIKLDGKLRGYPVSGSGSINWFNNGLDINSLKLYSGKSSVKIRGRFGSAFNVYFDLVSNNFSELYPNSKGQLYASGFLSGNSEKPYIKTKIKAVNLQIPNYKVSNLNTSIGLDLFNWQKIDINLSAQGVKVSDYMFNSININTDNNGLKATVVSQQVTADVELKGKTSENGWQGKVTQANISSDDFGDWHLKRETELVIKNKDLKIKLLCFISSESKICGDVNLTAGELKSSLNFTKTPLKIINVWLPNGIKLNGYADASANLNFNTHDNKLSRVDIISSSGYLSYPLSDGQYGHVYYSTMKANLVLDSESMAVKAFIALDNGDNAKLNLKLPGLKINELNTLNVKTQKINVNFKIVVNDLRAIEAMLPEIHEFKGAFDLSLTAKGTIDQPKINLRAKLNDGSFKIPLIGLKINNIDFKSSNSGFNKITYNLNANSGTGNINILGNVLLDDKAGWPSVMTITGDSFDVVAIPEAIIAISPQIKLISKNKIIKLSGEINIPVAKIIAKDFTQASQISPDAVIGNVDNRKTNNWSVSTKLKATLGKKVTFKGYGFDGRLEGSLKLQKRIGVTTTAVGEVLVTEGKYTAYGQNLDVTDGRLLFTGGPITNPGLNLRAIRKIGDITAGLKVRGSLYLPKVELFSIPVMEQTEALSYLILGRPLDDNSKGEDNMVSKAVLLLSLSSGNVIASNLGKSIGLDDISIKSSNEGEQASLVVGRYISPKLYISYGVGLIEAINTFKVRYQISERWQVIGENGEFQGADIFYVFDK